MNKLEKISELIDLVKNDDQVKRYQELEKLIKNDLNINNQLKEIKELQKRMVKQEYSGSFTLDSIKNEYNRKIDDLKAYPYVEEYLELLEYINDDLQLIIKIIEDEIALDFID